MSGGTQQAPTPYQPPNQAGAAQGFQTGTNQLASQGSDLYNQVAPALGGISQAIANNPFYPQALQGAQGAANQATNTVAPQQFAGAGQDTGIANLAALAGPGYANLATGAGTAGYDQTQSMLPGATAGAGVAPGVFNQAQSLIPQTTQGGNYAPGVLSGLAGAGAQASNNLTSMLPSTTGGAAYAPGALSALAQGGAATAGMDIAALQNLGTTGLQAGNQILNTGFDPQNALYNQQYQQQADQQNATAAQSGLAGSPYAAGLATTANQNFNINWQNTQLGREEGALGAYDSAASTYAGDTANLSSGAINNLATGINSGVNDYNSLTSTAAGNAANLNNSAIADLTSGVNSGVSDYNNLNAGAVGNLATLQNTGTQNFNALESGAVNNATNLINTGTGALNAGINTGVGALSTLGNQALTANNDASNLGTAGLNTLAGAAQLPSDVFLQQQQAELGALGSQITGTNAAASQTQQSVADQGNYLNIGQTASQGAIQAAQVNNQASAASAAGFGNLFGSIAGMFSFAA